MSNGSRPTARRQKTEPRARAEKLNAQGMPMNLAVAVAHGKLDLSAALERMARDVEVAKLEEEHQINRALAVQVALGHADINAVLWRRRLDAHRKAFRSQTRLVEDASVVLGLHGSRLLRGLITATDRYSVTVQPTKGELEQVHKLEIKYLYAPDDWKRARKAIRTDKSVAALKQAPLPRPQDRYGCSDKRLFRYIDEGADVVFTLLEGELIRGVPTWFSQYEVGVLVRGDVEIVVFRHAFHHVGT